MRAGLLNEGPDWKIRREEERDTLAWKEYLENVMKKRGSHWSGLYRACRDLNG